MHSSREAPRALINQARQLVAAGWNGSDNAGFVTSTTQAGYPVVRYGHLIFEQEKLEAIKTLACVIIPPNTHQSKRPIATASRAAVYSKRVPAIEDVNFRYARKLVKAGWDGIDEARINELCPNDNIKSEQHEAIKTIAQKLLKRRQTAIPSPVSSASLNQPSHNGHCKIGKLSENIAFNLLNSATACYDSELFYQDSSITTDNFIKLKTKVMIEILNAYATRDKFLPLSYCHIIMKRIDQLSDVERFYEMIKNKYSIEMSSIESTDATQIHIQMMWKYVLSHESIEGLQSVRQKLLDIYTACPTERAYNACFYLKEYFEGEERDGFLRFFHLLPDEMQKNDDVRREVLKACFAHNQTKEATDLFNEWPLETISTHTYVSMIKYASRVDLGLAISIYTRALTYDREFQETIEFLKTDYKRTIEIDLLDETGGRLYRSQKLELISVLLWYWYTTLLAEHDKKVVMDNTWISIKFIIGQEEACGLGKALSELLYANFEWRAVSLGGNFSEIGVAGTAEQLLGGLRETPKVVISVASVDEPLAAAAAVFYI